MLASSSYYTLYGAPELARKPGAKWLSICLILIRQRDWLTFILVCSGRRLLQQRGNSTEGRGWEQWETIFICSTMHLLSMSCVELSETLHEKNICRTQRDSASFPTVQGQPESFLRNSSFCEYFFLGYYSVTTCSPHPQLLIFMCLFPICQKHRCRVKPKEE